MSGPPQGPGPVRQMSVGNGPPSAGLPPHNAMPPQGGPPPPGASGPQSQQNLNQIVGTIFSLSPRSCLLLSGFAQLRRVKAHCPRGLCPSRFVKESCSWPYSRLTLPSALRDPVFKSRALFRYVYHDGTLLLRRFHSSRALTPTLPTT